MNRARSVWPVAGESAARAASSRCFISPAVWKRSLGSTASARATISSTSRGMAGSTWRGARVRPCRTNSSTEISLSPVNSRSPVTISNSTAPREKRSERASTGRPQACSGDMYWSFPLRAPIWVCPTLETALAMPKSHSLTSPSPVRRTFCGETSRWTSPSSRSSKSRLRWA